MIKNRFIYLKFKTRIEGILMVWEIKIFSSRNAAKIDSIRNRIHKSEYMKQRIGISLKLCFVFIVLSSLLVSNVGAQQISVTWQSNVKDPQTGKPINIGAGGRVNNDPINSKVTILVTHQDNCKIDHVDIVRSDAFGDDTIIDPGVQMEKDENGIWQSIPKTPPSNPNIARSILGLLPFAHAQTVAYVNAYVTDTQDGSCPQKKNNPYQSSQIIVPDTKITEDKGGANINVGGKATGQTPPNPFVNGKVDASGNVHREEEHDNGAIYLDPIIHNRIIVENQTLPSGWTLDIEPKDFALAPNETKVGSLVFRVPSEGYAIYYIESTTSNYTVISNPMVLIATKELLPPMSVKYIQQNMTLYKVYHSLNNSDIANISVDQSTNSLSLTIIYPTDGVVKLMIPTEVLDVRSNLNVSVDNQPKSIIPEMSNDLFTIIDVPFHAPVSTITITGTTAFMPTATAIPTATPAPTLTTAQPTATRNIPGFGLVLSLAGMLAMAYRAKRQNK